MDERGRMAAAITSQWNEWEMMYVPIEFIMDIENPGGGGVVNV